MYVNLKKTTLKELLVSIIGFKTFFLFFYDNYHIFAAV